MSAWEITNSIALLLIPPGCLLMMAAAGAAILRRRRRLGWSLIGVSWLALYVLSTTFVSDRLLQSLEPEYRDPAAQPAGQAIVVMGGGKYRLAPEYGGDTVSSEVLSRLRYAARLHRMLGKPVLVTGGSPEGDATTEAAVMKSVLEHDFQTPVRWVEGRSRNSDENARYSFEVLKSAGVSSIYLVTHAWHMQRARLAFEHAGFGVIPAPTRYATDYRGLVPDFLPRASALRDSSVFLHEAIGLAWYRLKFFVSSWSSQTGEGGV